MVPFKEKVLKYGTPKPSYRILIETLIDPFKEGGIFLHQGPLAVGSKSPSAWPRGP